MAAKKLRPIIREPQVLLFRGRGVISSLIRWQTRGAYSHAAILRPDGTIIESWQGAGVRIKDITDWRGVDRFDVPLMSPEMWASALTFADSMVGSGYDYWAIARFVSRARMPDNQRWFCSELVFAALAHAGLPPLARVEPWAVSPGVLATSPYLRKVEHPVL